MEYDPDSVRGSGVSQGNERPSQMGLAIAIAALAAVGAGIAIQQIWEHRLTKPEKTRLRFYRYLRERGRLES